MYWTDGQVALHQGDVRDVLREMPAESVQCVVTSPPYWGLRDYGVAGQLGLEATPEAYVTAMVEVFREVRRVLRNDGTLWLNIGDTYNAYNGGAGPSSSLSQNQSEQRPRLATGYGLQAKSLKPKDLVGIPWMLAFALRADGWWLRQDIIWSKPNPMPESVRDRCTKAHEYLFLLSKRDRYYYDADAVREASDYGPLSRPAGWATGADHTAIGWATDQRQGRSKQRGHVRPHKGFAAKWDGLTKAEQGENGRNKRSVWTIATEPYPEAHFATFPMALVTPCVLAGSRVGDVVLDPFIGSGTTAMVARNLGRRAIGIDLNAEYLAMAKRRVGEQLALLGDAR